MHKPLYMAAYQENVFCKLMSSEQVNEIHDSPPVLDISHNDTGPCPFYISHCCHIQLMMFL